MFGMVVRPGLMAGLIPTDNEADPAWDAQVT